MPITIGSNIASLKAQRQLGRASDALASTYERLASGQRINKASDDAAGLSVSTSLQAKSKIYAQGVRNVNDAISAANIAQGAAESLTNVLIRLKELAEQAANGTYGTTQRNSMDTEAQALRLEYHRIVKSTSFNGQQLIDGNGNQIYVQAGDNTGGLLSLTTGVLLLLSRMLLRLFNLMA